MDNFGGHNRSQAKIWHNCLHEQKFAVATFQLSSIVAYRQTMYVQCFSGDVGKQDMV